MPALVGDNSKERLIGLDLARAAAILGVLIVHFGRPVLLRADVSGWPIIATATLGGMGVELFFALSGFLIGSLLLEIVERDPGLRSWFAFLVRRWMRTLPLYFLWVAILLIIHPPKHYVALHALEYFTFTQNLAWPMPSKWFGVSWSLAVEEWFYLLFSALLLALAVRTRHWAVLISCSLFIAIPLVLRGSIGPIGGDLDAGFRKVVAFRLDAITYGVLFAWLYRYWRDALNRQAYPLLVLGVFLIVFRLTYYTGVVTAVWPNLAFTLVPLGFSLMMPWAMQVQIGSSLLSSVISWLSTRSYCIYITHASLLQLCNKRLGELAGGVFAGIIALLACGLLAELSYRYFEMPILRRRPRQFPRKSDGTEADRLQIGEEVRARSPV